MSTFNVEKEHSKSKFKKSIKSKNKIILKTVPAIVGERLFAVDTKDERTPNVIPTHPCMRKTMRFPISRRLSRARVVESVRTGHRWKQDDLRAVPTRSYTA